MTRVLITHSCGHEQIDNIYVSGRIRRDREKWLSTVPCSICQGDWCRKNDFADGYPSLTGSKSQNAWAYQIRHDVIMKIKNWIAQFSSNNREEYVIKRIGLHRLAFEIAKEKESAKWWIDNRDFAYETLLDEAKTLQQQKGK